MKRIIFILALSIGLITYSHSQNMIIAGQTTGTNIQYTDYIPDLVVIAEDPVGFKLDLDGNGTDDLYLFVGVTIEVFPFDELWTWSTVKLLSSNVKILLSADSLYWIKKLNAGDTISENNIWGYNTDTVYYLQKYYSWSFPPPAGQIFQGEWQYSHGYLGFQMNLPSETFYGWINLVTNNFMITAKESAIRGLTTGISEIIDSYNSFELYPNPCSDILTIEPNLDNYKGKRIEIVKLDGKIAMTCDIFGDKTKIDTQHLVPGIYLIRIKEENKVILQSKFLKI